MAGRATPSTSSPEEVRIPDARQNLRATSDALLRDLDALAALEAEKRSLPANDPRTHEIAERVEAIARRILQGSIAETGQTAEAIADRGTVPIEQMRRTPADILAEWRAIERRAAEVDPASAEALELEHLRRRLRDEYRAAFEAARGR